MTEAQQATLPATELHRAADRARAAFDWESARSLYTQALEGADATDPQTIYTLLEARAECHRFLGRLSAEDADLEAMAQIVPQMKDPCRGIEVMNRQVAVRILQGRLAEARTLAETSLALARDHRDRKLEADSLAALGNAYLRMAAYEQGRGFAEAAMVLYCELGDETGEALCHYLLSLAASRLVGTAHWQAHALPALDLYRRLGDRVGEGTMLNLLGTTAVDLGRRRSYLEQALAAFTTVSHSERQSVVHNNLALAYWRLGLYGRAREYAEQAVQRAQQMGARYALAAFVDSLARTYLACGLFDQAVPLFREGLALAQETGDPVAEYTYWLGLGQCALAQGQAAESLGALQRAADLASEAQAPAERASALAWLGATHQALGDPGSAQACTAEAVAFQESAGETPGEFLPQEVWWLRFRALTACTDGSRPAAAVPEEAWQALDQARTTMLEGISTLSDDGLRRNYLCRVDVNRQIIQEWLQQADRRGLPLAPLAGHLSGAGDLAGQFQRLLDIGVRLNARSEAGDLPQLIIDEVVELIGPERAALFLVDAQGERRPVARTGMQAPEPAGMRDAFWLEGITPLLDRVTQKRAPLLRHIPEDASELEQRSVLCVPLVVQDRLVGLVYADLPGIYGRFTDRDRDLLSVLANQAAVAVENTRWTETLEQRVAERTSELEAANQGLRQRTAELEIVNSVQHGLAAQLDMQDIYDLVGERIRTTFQADSASIYRYDRQASMVHVPYAVEGDHRFEAQSFPLGRGLTSRIIQTRQPLVAGTQQECLDLGASLQPVDPEHPEEELVESYLGVPLIVGGEVIGVIDVQSYRQHAYEEASLRLLSTLAASMGVALENARLFEETNRLLAETQQRNAELAVINSVQEGLARKLTFQGIIDLVGDKLRQVFGGVTAFIALYDESTNLIEFPYWLSDDGQRIEWPPAELGQGLTSIVIRTRQPLVLGTLEEMDAHGGIIVNPDEPQEESWMGVPILAGERVMGVVAMQDWPQHRYTDSDARLLSTITASMGVALENARLFEETNRLLAETQQRNAELAVINSVQEGLARQLTFQGIIDLVGDKVRETLRGQETFIALYDMSTTLIQIPYWVSADGERVLSAPMELGQGLTSIVIQTRQPLVLGTNEECCAHGAVEPHPEDPRTTESWMGVPILTGEKAIGVVAIQDRVQHRYGESDVRLLSTLAASMGVALENARLFEETNRLLAETQQRNAELAVLSSVQQGLVAELEMQAIYDLVGDLIRDTFDAQAVLILSYDHDTGMQHTNYNVEKGQRFFPGPAPFNALHRHLIETGRVVLINENAEQAAAELGMRLVPGTETPKSMLFVPLVVGQQVRGAVSLQNVDHELAFSDSDVSLLTTLANTMSVALESARRFEETQQRNAELAVINSVQQGLARKLDFQGIIDLVGDKLREVFGGVTTSIALYDEGSNQIHLPYWLGDQGQRIESGPFQLGEGLTSVVIRRRRPLVLGTCQEQDDLGAVLVEDGEPRRPESWMGVPILVGERVNGVVAVCDWPRHRYSESDARLLSTITASMGVALENARLFEETNRLLAETQQRNAELAVINSVQQGLVAELEMQAICDLVGNLVRDTFDAQVVDISAYDHAAELVITNYIWEKGKRYYPGPMPFNALQRRLIDTRQAVLVNENVDDAVAEFGLRLVPGTEPPKSMLFVPLVVGHEVRGAVSLQNLDHEHAFSDSDVRLLTTLGNTMSVALESARLFEETQQRSTELGIINSVQQGLAQQLDFQRIVDLVGDRVRDTFRGETTFIALYDRGTNLIRIPYWMSDTGQRLEVEPIELGPGLTSAIIQSSQPLVLGTLEEQIRLGAVHVDDGTGRDPESWMGVPILVGEEVTGVVAVQDWPQNRYDEADVRLLSTLAASMGVALENARLFEETNRLLAETQQRNAELAVINSVQQGLVAELDMQAIYDLVGDQIRNTFDAQAVLLATYDLEAHQVSIHYGFEKGQRFFPAPVRFNALHRHLLDTRQVVRFDENAEQAMAELGMAIVPGTEMPRSAVFVPLVAGGDVKGYVSLQNIDREHAFTDSDVRLLTTLANTMSVALESARLFAETQQRSAELAVINEVGQALARQLDAGAIAELVGAKVTELFAADGTTVVLYDRQTGLVHLPYMVEGDHRYRIDPYPLGPGLNSRVIETRKPLLLSTLQEQEDLGGISYSIDADAPDEQRVQSWLGVPLIVGTEATGVLNVQSYRPHAFGAADVRLLNTIAANAGVALENARLFAETNRLLDESRRRAAELATVNRVSQALASELELDALMQLVGEQVRDTFEADLAYVALLDPQTNTIHFPYGYGDQFPSMRLGEGLTSRIIETGQPALINEDVLGRYAELGIEHVGTPSRSYLGVPIPIGRDVIGVISVQSTQETGCFGEDDVRLLATIAANVGAAIQNARLFAQVEGQKQYSESVVRTSPVAIVTVDKEGQVLTWNPAAEALFGYAEAEAVGRALDPLITTPEIAEEALELTRQTVAGSSVHVVTRRARRDGTLVDVEVLSAPVDVADPDAGYIAIYHDISELKRAEQELHAAKEAAEAATQAKSAFLATMSHEIRTPMNAVIGMTSLLLDTELTPEQQEFASTIRSSGDALLNIINDILDFSKIEAGRIDLEYQPFDLRECVESALGLVASQAAAQGLEMGCWIDPQVPAGISGDETRLRQILLNLLSNAVKFTEEGEVVVNVTVGDERKMPSIPAGRLPSSTVLHFSVRDTGIGIPPDRMDRLFLSFSQIDSSTTRKYGGTGLGLAISQRLAELMGGRMWAESPGIPGQGSTFHFSIQAQPAAVPTRAELEASAPDLEGRHVLIVDDNATSRRILTLQVRTWGMVPESTGRPTEALAWIQRGDAFDVAIVDRQMPEMDGVMLGSEIRRLSADLPLVMVSSLGRGEAEEGESFAAFLVKPVRASQLYNALLGILAGRPEAQAASRAPATPKFDPEMGVRHPLRILLAEDNAVNQKLALRLLERLGYRADVAANGLEAIRAVERQPYDLIFMDVQMPEMDGLEATRAICARWPAGERPRIAAMTANALAEDREACLEAGMDDYLAKPIRVEELVAALRRTQPLTRKS